MKYIDSFEDWSINENKGNHSRGCMMLYVNFPVEEIQSKIKDGDIYVDEKDSSYGLEKDPHVTLLYGILDDKTTDKEVFAACEHIEFPDIELHNISCFNSKDYDVLKFDAKCEKLQEANTNLCKLPYKSDYPDYHPHSTIAYLKPGKGEEYVKMFKDYSYLAKPKKLVYSKSSGEQITKKARYIEKENNKDEKTRS